MQGKHAAHQMCRWTSADKPLLTSVASQVLIGVGFAYVYS
jgi:hypothetical protein